MAKLGRLGALDWALVAGLSLAGVACESAQGEEQQQGDSAVNSASGSGTTSDAAGTGSAAGGAGSGTSSGTNSGTSSGTSSGSSSGSAPTTGGTAAGGAGGSNGGSGGGATAGAGGSPGGTPAGSDAAGSGGTPGSSAGGAGGSAGGPSVAAGGAPGSELGGGVDLGAGGDSGGGGTNGEDPGGAGGASAGGAGGQAPGEGGETEVPTADVYNPDFVEFYGEDCEVGEPLETNNPKFPDLFEFFDGTRMTKKSEWRCRRAELKKAVEAFIHGEKPGRPDVVTGTVSDSSISVHVEHNGNSIDFSVQVSIPAGASTPAPAIIGLGGGSLDRGILTEEGVATINYNNNAMASETSRNGLFTDIYGNTGASAQVGWAWGVSRIIDVLVDERDAGRNDIIDPTAIGVTGCSRLGKGAFTIGAFDERIALGIPHESGTGGVSAFRIVNQNIVGPNGQPSQSLNSAWSEAQGWFGSVFGNYRSNVNVIPADTHSMVAMYAPRGFLSLDNSRIGELGSVAQHGATAAAAEVYKALGVEANVAYHGGNPSDPHNHCQFYPSQQEPLRRAIRGHLTRTAEPDGRLEPQPVATADLAEWVEWTTPTLE